MTCTEVWETGSHSIEALGKLSPTMQSGAFVNMFRVMIDHDGDIKSGIRSYSDLVRAEKERLSETTTPKC